MGLVSCIAFTQKRGHWAEIREQLTLSLTIWVPFPKKLESASCMSLRKQEQKVRNASMFLGKHKAKSLKSVHWNWLRVFFQLFRNPKMNKTNLSPSYMVLTGTNSRSLEKTRNEQGTALWSFPHCTLPPSGKRHFRVLLNHSLYLCPCF